VLPYELRWESGELGTRKKVIYKGKGKSLLPLQNAAGNFNEAMTGELLGGGGPREKRFKGEVTECREKKGGGP